MNKKKIPLRKCVGCNEQKQKKELIRVVKTKENDVMIDFTGKVNGRGAYICSDVECLKKAQKKRALNKSLGYQVLDEIYDKLLEELKNHEK